MKYEHTVDIHSNGKFLSFTTNYLKNGYDVLKIQQGAAVDFDYILSTVVEKYPLHVNGVYRLNGTFSR